MLTKLHEECGVFGIYLRDGQTGVVPAAYHALYALQHRGQESCGIAVNTDGVIACHKDVGLVNEVFYPRRAEKLSEGSMAVGHCRYATTGTQSRGCLLYTSSISGMPPFSSRRCAMRHLRLLR